MAVTGWLVDKSATSRGSDPVVAGQLAAVTEPMHLCEVGLLEQLYSSRSATHYDTEVARFRAGFSIVTPAPDQLSEALRLQQDLAHHHGMWHRLSIPDLLIAVTALHHGFGVLHVDGDYERIAEVRPLSIRRLG